MYSQNFNLLAHAANSTKSYGAGPQRRPEKFKVNNNNSGSLSIDNPKREQLQNQQKFGVSFNAKNAYRDLDDTSPPDDEDGPPDYSDNSFSNYRIAKQNVTLKPLSGNNDRLMVHEDSKSSLQLLKPTGTNSETRIIAANIRLKSTRGLRNSHQKNSRDDYY